MKTSHVGEVELTSSSNIQRFTSGGDARILRALERLSLEAVKSSVEKEPDSSLSGSQEKHKCSSQLQTHSHEHIQYMQCVCSGISSRIKAFGLTKGLLLI